MGRGDAPLDVVVVGGGIAGGALAAALARAGRQVLVLERDEVHRDRAMGEFLPPWGVREAMELGLEGTLLAAGGGYVRRIVGYDETIDPPHAERAPVLLEGLLPGTPGAIGVGHPQACEALLAAASAAGARVRRGVSDVEVTAGRTSTVAFTAGGSRHEVRTRLVIGADGRGSSLRRHLGLGLRRTMPATVAVAMLLADVSGWPDDVAAVGTEGGVHFLVFPRPAGFVRLALLHDLRHRERFTGQQRHEAVMAAVAGLRSVPTTATLLAGRIAGPCLTYAMNDTWVDAPGTPELVLAGDAAGWSDPIIGQGLALALCDARALRDRMVDGWSAAAFESYARERRERMRRLRVASHLATQLRCTFSADGSRRRALWVRARTEEPLLGAALAATLVGPAAVPAEAFSASTVRRILGIGDHPAASAAVMVH